MASKPLVFYCSPAAFWVSMAAAEGSAKTLGFAAMGLGFLVFIVGRFMD